MGYGIDAHGIQLPFDNAAFLTVVQIGLLLERHLLRRGDVTRSALITDDGVLAMQCRGHCLRVVHRLEQRIRRRRFQIPQPDMTAATRMQ